MKREQPTAAELQGLLISTTTEQLVTAARFIKRWGGIKTRTRSEVILFIKATWGWNEEVIGRMLDGLTKRPRLYQNGSDYPGWFLLEKSGPDRYRLVSDRLNGAVK